MKLLMRVLRCGRSSRQRKADFPSSFLVHRPSPASKWGTSHYPSWANDEDPALAKKILDDGLAGAVAEVKSKLLEVEEISLQKHPGRQYTERMPNGNILRGKTFLAGNRLYQIAITTPKEEGKIPEAIQFYQVTANKFLGSFRLIAQ